MSFQPNRAIVLNYRRLFVVRSIAIGAEFVALFLATQVLNVALPYFLVVIFVHCFFNLLIWLRLQRSAPVTEFEFFIQITLDVFILTAFFYFTGGSTNPFVSLFLLPLVVTAATLSQYYTWSIAALTVLCYTLLIFFYVPLPMLHFDRQSSVDLHVLGMWFGFLLGAALIVFFVVRMANTLRERDAMLASTREQTIRDEHLVALGTLATGAAHELGTPLATMSVLVTELKREHNDVADIVDKADIIRQQLDRCKVILSNISASTGQARAESGRSFDLDKYLEAVVEKWRAARNVQIRCELDGIRPAPRIVVDKTLTQALNNILNNAADASSDGVEIFGNWDDNSLVLNICDTGPGLTPAVQATAGTPFFTTKANGQGLGLYLARAVIDRYDGSVELSNREGGGTRAQIKLKLSKLEITNNA